MVAGLAGCQKEQINTGPEESGLRQLIIRTSVSDGSIPEDYTIQLTGPKSLTIVNSGKELLVNEMLDGEYIVQVSKPGYIGSSRRVNFKSSPDPEANDLFGISLQLNKQLPWVPIDHQSGKSFVIADSESIYEKTIEVIIPSGAIEGSGSSEISITPAKLDISPLPGEYTEVVQPFSLVCQPMDLKLNRPVTIRIALDLGQPWQDQVGDFILFEEDPITQEWTPSKKEEDRIKVSVEPNGEFAVIELPVFGVWGWTLTSEKEDRRYWRIRNTRGAPDDDPLWTNWTCIDQSPSPGAIVSGIHLAQPATLQRVSGSESELTNYCLLSNFSCSPGITESYQFTPSRGDLSGKVRARNRFIYIDISTDAEGVTIVATGRLADPVAAIIQFWYKEILNPTVCG